MTVFHEPWWLDAVAPAGWDEVTVAENGTVVGRFPFQASKVLGRRVIGMPPLTRTLGPVVRPGTGKPQTERQRETRIVGELIAKLPQHVYFKQLLSPDYHNPLPFQFSGFSLSFECVYTLDCRGGAERVWQDLPSKTRTMIRHARNTYELRTCDDVEAFHRLYSTNIADSGRTNHFCFSLIARLHTAACRENAGRILALHDAHGAMVAAIFVVWSSTHMHFLLQTRAATSLNGTVECLVWQAALLAGERGLVFDLDGVASESAARRMAQFGGELQRRTVVTGGAFLLPAVRQLQRELRWQLGRRDRFV